MTEKVAKITQAEGVFYYNTTIPHKGRGMVEAQLADSIYDFEILDLSEVPDDVFIRSENDLEFVLMRERKQIKYAHFEVVLKDQTKRYFKVPGQRAGVSNANLRNAREDGHVVTFRRVKVEKYEAFQVTMAKLILGL